MHPIFQSFKRTYWASMRFSRAFMERYKEYGITPARFDMLLVIAGQGGKIAQTTLREVLDVCPSVVTVMLDSLEHEDLGYVVRTPLPGARGHAKLVIITELGSSLLHEIIDEMLTSGFTEYCVRRVLADTPTGSVQTERVLARTRRIVRHLRWRVRDSSTLVYPAYLASGERHPDHPYTCGAQGSAPG